MIRVAFRLDDPSETSHQGVETGIMDILRKYRASATFATIPFRMVNGERKALSNQRAHLLIEAAREGLIEIALHGHVHVRQQPEPARPTEFSGRPQAEQQTLIEEGCKHLEQIFNRRVSGFVPPWNSYDIATLHSLDALGFRYVSAGWEQPANYRGHLKLLPRTTQLSDIPAALQEARRFEKARPVIVIVLHHFDFSESGSDHAVIDMQGFDTALAQIQSEPDVCICTLGDLSDTFSASNRQTFRHQQLMQNHLVRRMLPKRCFLDSTLWHGVIAAALHG
jgi:predicted deacetylase